MANDFEKLFYVFLPFYWQDVSYIKDFCGRESHHIFSHDQQGVGDIAYFVKDILITSFPYEQQQASNITHLGKGVSSHFFLWPTGSQWRWTYWKGSLITSFPMTNSLWVTLHIFCTRQFLVSSHFSYHKQGVSDIAHLMTGSLIISFPTGCEWQCTFCERQLPISLHPSHYQQLVSDIAHSVKGSLVTSIPMTNSKWVTLPILWKSVSSIFSYDQ